MNLVQLGTTASRANREKSVKNSIAQRIVQADYGGNGCGNVSVAKQQVPPLRRRRFRSGFGRNDNQKS